MPIPMRSEIPPTPKYWIRRNRKEIVQAGDKWTCGKEWKPVEPALVGVSVGTLTGPVIRMLEADEVTP